MSKEFHIILRRLYTDHISMFEIREVLKMNCDSSLQTERFVTYKVVRSEGYPKRLSQIYTISMRSFLKWVNFEVELRKTYINKKAIY